jgi:hypothetical protein
MEPWLDDYIRQHLEEVKKRLSKINPSNSWQIRIYIELYKQVLLGKRGCKFIAVLNKKPGSSTQERVLADTFADLVDKLNNQETLLADIFEVFIDIPEHGALRGAYKLVIPQKLHAPFWE